MTFDKWFQQQREDTDLFGAKCTGLESLVYLAMKRAWESGYQTGYSKGDYLEGLEGGIKIGKHP